jgi:hypothetical protein
MLGTATVLIASPIPRNIDPAEGLRYFSWWGFAIGAAVYSACIFSRRLAGRGFLDFSRRPPRPASRIAAVHFACLAFLLGVLRAASYLVPLLPYWMTDTFRAGRGASLSIADLAFLALILVLLAVERLWLYAGSAH